MKKIKNNAETERERKGETERVKDSLETMSEWLTLGVTTVRPILLDDFGLVLTWHSYTPESVGSTPFI